MRDPDALLPELLAQGVVQAYYGELGRVVDGPTGEPVPAAYARYRADHRPGASAEERYGRPGTEQHTVEVGVDGGPPFLSVALLELPVVADPGVVEEQVDAVVVALYTREKRPYLVLVADVRRDRNRCLAQFSGEVFYLLRRAGNQHHADAFGDQLPGRGLANATRGTGDHRDLAFQRFELHAPSFLEICRKQPKDFIREQELRLEQST